MSPPLSISQGAHVKVLHLSLAALLVTSVANAGSRFPSKPLEWFRPSTKPQVIFRAQNGGVPTPQEPGATGTGDAGLQIPDGSA